MFDFERLEVYSLSKEIFHSIQRFLKASPQIDRDTRSQLRRAAMSICLNIAEGCGRFSHADKRNFYVIARGSVFECVALLGLINDENLLTDEHYQAYYKQFERVSRMLFGMINKLGGNALSKQP
jgi:four helix bundle protein